MLRRKTGLVAVVFPPNKSWHTTGAMSELPPDDQALAAAQGAVAELLKDGSAPPEHVIRPGDDSRIIAQKLMRQNEHLRAQLREISMSVCFCVLLTSQHTLAGKLLDQSLERQRQQREQLLRQRQKQDAMSRQSNTGRRLYPLRLLSST